MRKNLDVLGIGDNIYNRVVRDGEKPVPLFSDFAPDLADRVAEVFGAAKDGGLASERVSWICGPLEWIERAVNKKIKWIRKCTCEYAGYGTCLCNN